MSGLRADHRLVGAEHQAESQHVRGRSVEHEVGGTGTREVAEFPGDAGGPGIVAIGVRIALVRPGDCAEDGVVGGCVVVAAEALPWSHVWEPSKSGLFPPGLGTASRAGCLAGGWRAGHLPRQNTRCGQMTGARHHAGWLHRIPGGLACAGRAGVAVETAYWHRRPMAWLRSWPWGRGSCWEGAGVGGGGCDGDAEMLSCADGTWPGGSGGPGRGAPSVRKDGDEDQWECGSSGAVGGRVPAAPAAHGRTTGRVPGQPACGRSI